MSTAMETPQYEALTALIDALASDPALTAAAAGFRGQQERARAALRKQGDNLDSLYGDIACSEADARYVAQMAGLVLQKERAATERLGPDIERLKEKLTRKGQ